MGWGEPHLWVDGSPADRVKALRLRPAANIGDLIGQALDLVVSGMTVSAPVGCRAVFAAADRLRHTLAPDGSSITFAAAGESGKGSWVWELTDPNGAITIPPLVGCDSATNGLPMISGGYQKTVTGDVMVYQAYHGEKVVPFYQEEMVAGGWKQSGAPTSKDGVMTVAFTKDGQKALVTVTPKGQISDVMIEVTKEQ